MIERADSRLQSNLEKLGKLKLDLDNIKCGYTRSSYTCVNVPLVEIRDGVYDGLIESSKQVGDLIVIANEQLDKDSIETLDSIGKMNLLLSKIDDGLYKIYNKEEVVETVDGELNNIDENNNSEVKGVTEEIIPENIEVIKGVTETTVDIIKEEDTE